MSGPGRVEGTPLRVVVVDDSPFVCRYLKTLVQTSRDLRVVGTALDGLKGLELVKACRPDVVTLDLEMPRMNGLEMLLRLMEECPTPVVVLSGVSRRAASVTTQAIDLGAVDFILKYMPGTDVDPEALRLEIQGKLRAAAQIRVIRTLPGASGVVARRSFGRPMAQLHPELASPMALARGVIIVGASTGGPLALRELLSNVPGNFRVPIVVVQHMPETFTSALAAHLDRLVPFTVKEAEERERLEPGKVLIAPGGYHVLFRSDGSVSLNQGPEIGGHRPSVDVAMQSAAQVFGSLSTGVLLTGMGEDGAMGLLAIHAKGGTTFAQDAASCVVNGMPQRAIEKGVVDHVAPPCEIAKLLSIERPAAYQKGA